MASEPPPQPDFITFLLSDVPPFDCHFIVGDETLIEPEKIGAVKTMLMAHSVVFRSELEDSKLKEKGAVKIKDIYPENFKVLLKYVYGHDTTGDLEFSEADSMLYVAEKYLMSNLKNKVALRLIALLTPDNVCSLITNPAVSTQLQLKSAISEILQYETERVLASTMFLDLSAEGFITILEQDGLSVPEIELWRAAIKWAKHQAGSEDGQVLRQQLTEVPKHLKICSLTADQLCQDVTPLNVLSEKEVHFVVKSIGSKQKYEELTEINNEVEPRKRLHKRVRLVEKQASASCVDQELNMEYHGGKAKYLKSSYFTIVTKQHAIELLPLMCLAEERGKLDPKGWTYTFSCIVTITKYSSRYSFYEPPLQIRFSKYVEYGAMFEVPLAVDGFSVTLHPHSKYKIEVSPSNCYYTAYKRSDDYTYENEDMILCAPSHAPSNCLRYRRIDNE